jgi:hypothetical protein
VDVEKESPRHAVWKYPVPIDDVFSVDMPWGAEVLSVAVQGSEVCMWAEVNPGAAMKLRRFRMCGTGHHMPMHEARRFVGTFLLHGGSLVFHLFELDAVEGEGGG